MLFEKIHLESDEKIITTVRMHWLIITLEILAIAFVGLIPFLLGISTLFFPTESTVRIMMSDYFIYFVFFSCIWLVYTTIATISVWTHYYLDLWIITDRRIIVIDQVHFFNRKVSSFRLERLQDIKVRISGIIPTLFNYGTIRAQTASAAESNFTSPALPDPRNLQALIQSAMDARLAKISTSPNHLNID
jgi:hypothetical protein